MIHLYVITFGRVDLLPHQKRLLDKYLLDDYRLQVIDNTPDANSYKMQEICFDLGIDYMYSPSEQNLHNEALNFAALHVTRMGYEHFGFLDHDVFPRRETTLIDKIDGAGFYGVGQRHPATGHQYLWPGFCFFSKKWLNGRELNFDGIRSVRRRDNGDTGSANWPLFTDEDWEKLWGMEHGYKAIREPDSDGLQSWGIEILGDFYHFTNASHWKKIQQPQERDRALNDILEAL